MKRSPRDELRDPASLDSSELNELVALCVERFDSEGDAALEQLCREHPSRADHLRSRVRALQRAGLIGGAPMPGTFPERLGEFRLVRHLGGGGMGVVYLAIQEPLGREVALKLVRPDQLYFPGARERFRREMDVVAKLQHPGIVPVYTSGEEQGMPFFAMERVRGCTLAEALHELEAADVADLSGADLGNALRACAARHDAASAASAGDASASAAAASSWSGSWIETCVRIAHQAALALEHVHARGVLHRDVKASNLMLTVDGRVLLSDFGLATTMGASHITRTGSQLGSLPYMAPEQLRGEPAHARTDVYALGVTLYELLTLATPFHADSTEATRQAILRGAPRRPSERNHAVPWDVETVCLSALDADAARRYPSAAAFARDLANLLALRPIEARRPKAGLRARRWIQRHPVASTASALGFLLLVVAPSVAWWRIRVERDQALVELRARRGMFDFLHDVLAAATSSRSATGELPSLDQVVDAGAQKIREELREHPKIRMELLANLASAQGRLGRPREAIELYEEALAIARELGVEERSFTLTVRQAVAAHLVSLGELDRAQQLLSEVRAEVVAAGPVENVDLWSVDSARIGALLVQRRFDEARAALEAAETDPALTARGGKRRIEWLTYQAETEKGFGSLDQASVHLTQAVELAGATWGQRHVETARAMQNLAALHSDMGKPELALPLLEDVRDIRAAASAPESVEDARLAGNLAAIYNRLGRLDEALAGYQRSLELCRRFCRDSAQTARAASGTGALLFKRERLDEAEVVLREAVELSRMYLPRRGLTGAEAPLWLGRCMARKGNAEEALALFQEVLECTQDDASVPPKTRAKFESETADLLEALGRVDDARELRARAQSASGAPVARPR